MQKKIGELNAKCILLKQRKGIGAFLFRCIAGGFYTYRFVFGVVSTELAKSNTSKAKLEQLCRELQKQNKLIVVRELEQHG